MARFNIQVSMAADTVLPRDRIVNVWHFDRPTFPEAPDRLCEDMAVIYDTKMAMGPGRHEYDVRLYEETQVGPPKGRHVLNPGIATASLWPREVALCLSFRGAQNIPSQRGRIYLSPGHMTQASPAVRPTDALMTKVLGIADAVSGLGGLDVDWGVYSPTRQTFTRAEVAWVDDEFDTVRSRGMRATTRKQKAVSG